MSGKINLRDKLAFFEELWHPYIVAQMDNYHVKLAKVHGEFVWQTHDEQDELFLLLDGDLTIQLRDRNVTMHEGDLFVVPAGVEHCPKSENGASVLVLDRIDTKHSGEVSSHLTVPDQDWI
jgi:mannose-6-phosphate isomerase-like protein (cupin superfamily)